MLTFWLGIEHKKAKDEITCEPGIWTWNVNLGFDPGLLSLI